ncbi:MAG: leucine-rich repeat protein [Bacteroidales bacterium]|nr:leucine-rich repeat protein [Bacteroidales bacterium]
MKTDFRKFRIAFVALFVAACTTPEPDPEPGPDPGSNNGETAQTWSVNGNVQKGPFTQGTSITIQALDESLNPTGKNYSTKTTDDAGTFSIGSQIESRYVEIFAQGYYFNEIEGKVSSSTLTLRSLSDLNESGKTNVNLLTTLESDRMVALVKTGKTVAEARKQAEQEIFRVFNIPNTVGDSGFDKMDITKGTDADAILLAISASLQANRSVGELSELISKIAGELASSGKVESEIIRSQILEGSMKVDADAVRDNLTKRYQSLGISGFVIPPFEDYLDVNGNGVIDKRDSWIILGQSEFVVSDKGGSFTLTLQSNVEYEVSVEGGDWLSWQPATKAYLQEAAITFNAVPNQEPDARYAVISIKDKASSHVEKAKVTQKQKDALTVSAASVELEKEGGSFDITIGYNADVRRSIDVSWITEVQTKAMESSTITYTATANPEKDTRTGHVVFTMGDLTETVTVYQKGGRTLVLSEKAITVGPDGGSVSVQATANVDYEVIGPGVAWLTLQEGAATKAVVTDSYSWTVSPNDTGEQRQATIIFKDKESDLSETVTVTQLQNDIVDGQDAYTIPWEGGMLEVQVQTNADFAPSIEQEGNWLSIVQTKAMHSSTVTLNAQANPDISPRTAYMVLTTDQDAWRITITQRANAQQITVHVPTPGTLSQVISEEDLHKIINLKITGKLNEEDLELLKGGSYSPGDIFNPNPRIESDWCVEELDLSEMTTTTNETGIIFQCVPSLLKVVMPLHVETVTADCFKMCINLETIDFGTSSDILTLGGSVQPIGVGAQAQRVVYFGAFNECTSLKSVTLPDNLEDFQAGAFLNCTSLEEIIFPASCNVRTLKPSFGDFYNGLDHIYYPLGHFNGCTSLETLTLPASLRTIRANALSGGQFRRIVFPDGLTTVEGEYMFEGCTRLEEVSLPSCVTEYAAWMFAGCKNLKKIETAVPVTHYGFHCFDGANPAFLTLDPSIQYEGYVFANMDGESLTIPDGFTVIPEGMFSGWSKLVSLDLNGVQEIGEDAFYGNALKTIVLPESVKLVGRWAFYSSSYDEQQQRDYCPLESLVIHSERIHFDGEWPYSPIVGQGGYNDGNIKVLIGKNVKSVTGCLGGHDISEIVFEEGSQCEEFGIAQYTGISSIALPSSVKTLSDHAFAGCKLRNFDLPASLQTIGESAFRNCTELRKFNVPASVESIGNYAFGGCTKLYEFTIPANSSLTYLGESILGGADQVEPFVLNGSKELSVSEYVLSGSPFSKLTIGKNVKTLTFFSNGMSWAHFQFSGLETEDGSSLEELSGLTGGNFTANAVVSLPSLKVIGGGCFYGFTGTLSIDYSKLEKIGDSAFERCSSIPEDVIFTNLRSLGAIAFSNTPIKKVTFGPELTELGQFIFNESEAALTEVHFLGQAPPQTIPYPPYPIEWHWLGGNYQSSTTIYVPQTAFEAYRQAWGDAPWWNLVSAE